MYIYTHMYGARPSQSLSIGSAHNAVTTAKLTAAEWYFVTYLKVDRPLQISKHPH
jgi:hypothetical protein